MYTYCLNSPVIMADANGMCPHTAYAPWMGDCDYCVTHDVPLYDQERWNLCWAYSQTMVEDYHSNRKSTPSAAELHAIWLALTRKDKDGLWDKGGFPTNCELNRMGKPVPTFVSTYSTIADLFVLLQEAGPIYACYESPTSNDAHMVVVTGVNLKEGRVYTNNPWDKKGDQSYEEFTRSVVGRYGAYSYILNRYYIPVW